MSNSSSDPEMENWRAAYPLDFAWFGFAPHGLKEQYRDAGGNEHRTAGLQRVMETEVLAKLADGELQAFGFCVHPEFSSGAVEIPQFLFEALDTQIDWDKSTIAGLGRRFEGVKAKLASCPPSAEQLDELAECRITSLSTRNSKGGRHDTFPLSAQVLKCLFEIEVNRHLSAERLHPAFKLEFERRFSAIPGPSIRTLREQLKRFRQEPAEISSNQTAG